MQPIVEPAAVFSETEMRILRRWMAVYQSPAMAVLHDQAVQEFDQYDRTYFSRTGISEDDYVAWMVVELRREALQRFQELPWQSGSPDPDSPAAGPEDPAMAAANAAKAYARFEAECLRRHALEAARIPVRAYVARRLGLKAPPES